MKRMIVVLALAGCAEKGPQAIGPIAPDLAPLAAERPDEGCWHQTDLGWFETPCEDVDIASLQRALAARDLLDGRADGVQGPATRKAVQAYQTQYGLGSETLSLAAARSLGIVATPFD